MTRALKRWGKAWLSKGKFSLGLNPVIEKTEDFRRFIPEPFEMALLISADFELAWAPRYAKNAQNPLAHALEKARQERANIPGILEVAETFDIPITWATVGHLFLDSCRPANGKKHPEIPVVPKYQGPFWDFDGEDWFEFDPGTNHLQAPEWYAPELIRMILDSPVRHEIGCHTFSHIDCRDKACPPPLLRAELRASKAAAATFGLELRSFVHPGHTIGNLDVLAEEGFTSFRTDYRNVLGYPRKHANGLWELEQTDELNFRKEWAIEYHIYRYQQAIKKAIRSNTVCVFWFHPSFDPVMVECILPEVFGFIAANRHSIWITTHGQYVKWLIENGK